MIKQRIRDWLHECYIRRLGEKCRLALAAHDRPKTRLYWHLMLAAIKRRSLGQVERLERQRGLR